VEKEREAKEAEIAAKEKVDGAQIIAERSIEEQRIARELFLREKEIARECAIEVAEINHQRDINLADQGRVIAIAIKSKERSVAEVEADKERILAVKSQEQVTSTRQAEIAQRQKAIELIEARKKAERDTIGVISQAEARRNAAIIEAEMARIISKGEADKVIISAKAEGEAESIRLENAKKRYSIDTAGIRGRNEAENTLNDPMIALRTKMAIIEHLPQIIRESVKPMESIEGIKIFSVEGLNSGTQGCAEAENGGGSSTHKNASLADQLVNSALRYRGQAPLIDAILKEIGINSGDINGLTKAIRPDHSNEEDESSEEKK